MGAIGRFWALGQVLKIDVRRGEIKTVIRHIHHHSLVPRCVDSIANYARRCCTYNQSRFQENSAHLGRTKLAVQRGRIHEVGAAYEHRSLSRDQSPIRSHPAHADIRVVVKAESSPGKVH